MACMEGILINHSHYWYYFQWQSELFI